MATVVTCDGCGKRLDPVGQTNQVQVSIERRGKGGDYPHMTMLYDLCPRCESQLRQAADPHKWPKPDRAHADT